jgi:hypothetical protein
VKASLHRFVVASALVLLLTALFVQPAAATSSAAHGARHRVSSLHANVAQSAIPHISSVATAASSRILANFNGVSSLDSAITNFGAEFEPPDQGLCVGNGFVVEMVNSAFRVYDMHGNTLAGPTNVNAPFHEGFKQFTSDPRCQYDAATNTWFAVVLFLNSTFTSSRLDVAFNTSGDPTTPWSVFRINTTDAGAPASFGCPCFGDQPRLGIDQSNLYVGEDNFSINGPQFNGAEIYAISKGDLVAHAAKVHVAHYKNLFVGGAQAFGIQPAITDGPANAEYFMSSLDPNGTGDNRIAVWALTNVASLSAGGRPTLSSLVIPSEAYASPPPAQQMGSTTTLDSGDDRMQQTQFIGGEIWGELGTIVSIAGDPKPRAGAAWFRVGPALSGSVLGSANIDAQGYLGMAFNNITYPAIQANSSGAAAMVFTLTGPNRFASAAYSLMLKGSTAFGKPVVTAAGTGPYDADATRWGDYAWAVLDTTADAVWMADEYVPALSSQTTDGNNNWGTRVVEVSLI